MHLRPLLSAAAALGLVAAPAAAKDVVVQMRSQAQEGMMVGTMAFEPAYVSVNVGDTVRFMPTDYGHNAAPIEGMTPGGLNLPAGVLGKEYDLKVTKPGLYGIKCTPHFPLGMVALVKAGPGKAPNATEAAAAAAKLPPLAAKRMKALLAQANQGAAAP